MLSCGHGGESKGFSQSGLGSGPYLSVAICVTLAKFFNLSEPPHPFLRGCYETQNPVHESTPGLYGVARVSGIMVIIISNDCHSVYVSARGGWSGKAFLTPWTLKAGWVGNVQERGGATAAVVAGSSVGRWLRLGRRMHVRGTRR